MKVLKQALDLVLIIEKINRVIEFNQEAWLKSYICMNMELITKTKTDFEKGFFMFMNNFVLRKTMENTRNHRDSKLVSSNKRRNYLVSELDYHPTKRFLKNLMATEVNEMNKPLHLGISNLDISKITMYKYWYDK